MFQLKITLRNLRRGGIYSAINIGGMAIGMAAAILILAWIYHEWSYDRFHAKEKQLYKAYHRVTVDGSIQCIDWTPMIFGTTLKTDYPEIAGVTRTLGNTFLYANGESLFKIETGIYDTDFLTMFDFPLLYGNRETALNDPYSLILTEKAAIRLFGRDDPMGKTLLVNNEHSMMVTGVMKDLPGNTLFNFEAIVSFAFREEVQGRRNTSWTSNTTQTYVELHPNARLDLVNESIREILNTHSDNRAQAEVFLYPLNKQHLYYRFDDKGMPVGGLIEKLRIFGVIAGLILLIACINFTNLSTARSEKRAKEVGVRKVMGGKRFSLIGLFLGEATLIAFIAGAIALIIALMVLPVFSTLMGQQLTLNLSSVWFWLTGLGFVLITGLLAGSYPAFYLSSFLPVKVLKGMLRKRQGMFSSRKVLVVLQFTVTSALILSTLVIHRQIKHAKDRETGYNKEHLIYTYMEGEVFQKYEIIKQDLLNSGAAVSVAKTMSPMTARWNLTWNVDWQGKEDFAERTFFDVYYVNDDWAKTVGATIIDGRDIDIYTYPTDSTAMILNETAVKLMGLENPAGQIIKTGGRDWHVVGVVKDYILLSPYAPVTPVLIGGPAGWFEIMHIKLNSHNRTADNLAKVEQIFKRYNPAHLFEYRFIDEEYARKFGEEQKMGSLATWFAGLTIFISCMGLFALVAYMAETRRKEIGIRKVLGASVSDIVVLLSKEFLILVLISIAVASPVAWLIMDKWLSGYAYRTNIPLWLFVAVGCMCLCIALLTVGFQAIKAATANPVEAIKSE